jgi:hypothetical protein
VVLLQPPSPPPPFVSLARSSLGRRRRRLTARAAHPCQLRHGCRALPGQYRGDPHGGSCVGRRLHRCGAWTGPLPMPHRKHCSRSRDIWQTARSMHSFIITPTARVTRQQGRLDLAVSGPRTRNGRGVTLGGGEGGRRIPQRPYTGYTPRVVRIVRVPTLKTWVAKVPLRFEMSALGLLPCDGGAV